MTRSRFSEEQIIGVLREVHGGGSTRTVCAAPNISEGSLLRVEVQVWRDKCGRGDRRGQNGYIESFHDKRLDECLNRELFGSVLEARGHSRNLEDRIRRVTFAQFVRLTKARGGRAPGSLRPELLSTPKPTTTNKQQNFRFDLPHFTGSGQHFTFGFAARSHESPILLC